MFFSLQISCPGPVVGYEQVSNEKNPGGLRYIGDYTTQYVSESLQGSPCGGINQVFQFWDGLDVLGMLMTPNDYSL